MALRSDDKRRSRPRSFRGAPEGREPGIQKQFRKSTLDSEPGAAAPSRNDEKSADGSAKIRVARIGAAHGVRGEVKLWSFTEDPLAVADYGPLETADGARRFEIEALRPAKDFLVARLKGVADRNAAEMLRNMDLFVPRARLPAIEDEDTYYYADLVGLSVVTPENAAVGTVLALHNFGAGDLIEIAPAAGGQTLMLPFTESTVPEVDLAARRMVVVLPMESE
ncbi:MAG TPA: ribosome maturation factor RimM [Pseudolabrys sp.]|nr:ribosome maturation factor RimM [Pseudolabrys sp.]